MTVRNKIELEADDGDLLRRYAVQGSEEAFRRLVERHIDLVYSAALRQLRDPHKAQDVTQIVFLALARKAGKIDPRSVLAGWLVTATHFTAKSLRRGEARRALHETRAAEQRRDRERSMDSSDTDPPDADPSTPLPADREAWDRLSPSIDEALAGLSSDARDVLVLRFFKGQSYRSIGDQLGLTDEAARKRGERALSALRRAFQRRGITTSADALQAALGAAVLVPAPFALQQLMASAALTAGTGATPYQAAILKGTLSLMAISKVKIIVVATAALLLCGGGLLIYQKSQAPRDQVVRLSDVRLASPDANSALRNTSKDVAATGWQARFEAVYGLADGEVVKRVAPPFIPERQKKWDDEMLMVSMPPNTISPLMRLVFAAEGNGIHWTLASSDFNPRQAVLMIAKVKPWEIDDSIPNNAPFPGDWVIRKKATTEQLMAALGPVFSRQMGKSVRFEKRTQSREAIIVRGTFAFTPQAEYAQTADRDVLQLGNGKPDPTNAMYPNTIQQTTMDRVFRLVEDRTQCQVVDESGSAKLPVRLRDHGPVPLQSAVNQSDLLDQLHQETGLRFEREKRDVGVWFMVDGGTDASENGQ